MIIKDIGTLPVTSQYSIPVSDWVRLNVGALLHYCSSYA